MLKKYTALQKWKNMDVFSIKFQIKNSIIASKQIEI